MKYWIYIGLTLALCVILGACGFTPLHEPGLGAKDNGVRNLQIELIDGEDLAHEDGAFWVQQALYDRLGTSGGPHNLAINPRFSRPGFGVNASDIASRYDMIVSVNYVLSDIKSGEVLDQGTVRAVSTFGAPLDPYGRISAEKNAMQTVAKEAADRLIVKLAAYYASH